MKLKKIIVIAGIFTLLFGCSNESKTEVDNQYNNGISCNEMESKYINDLENSELKFFTFGVKKDKKLATYLKKNYNIETIYNGNQELEAPLCYNELVNLYLINEHDDYKIDSLPYMLNTGRYYFDFDQIEHYQIKMEGYPDYNNYDQLSGLEQLKLDLTVDLTPKDLTDTLFIKQLPEIGFYQVDISNSNFDAIKEIFRDRDIHIISNFICGDVYRDLLIFREKGEITGIAKLCFDCYGEQIIGSRFNTMDFGQNGNFQKLEQLLN